MSTISSTPKYIQAIVLYLVAVFFALIIFIIDTNVPLTIAFGSVYTIVILYSWLLPGRYASVYTGMICTILMIIGIVESPKSISGTGLEGVNAIISFIVVWVCVTLVTAAKRGYDGIQDTLDTLEDKVLNRTKELNKSKEELKESEQLYRYLYENANEMYVSIDPKDATIITCNETLCDKTGFSKDEIIGQSMYFIYHPDCHSEARKSFTSFEETKRLGGVDRSLRTKKGEKIDVILNVSAATDEKGNIQYYRSSWTDVTDYKNAQVALKEQTKILQKSQEELRESEQLYRYLYEHANEMYVSVNPDDATIVKCNETLCEKLGYSKEEIIGKPIFMVYHPDCMTKVEAAFKEFQEKNKVNGIELELKTKEGKKINVILNVSAAKDEKGNVLYSRSSWTDITKLKQAELVRIAYAQKLEIQNKELEQFAYIASHDLQEPLRTVTSFTDLLAIQYEDSFDETGKKSLQFILEATGRMRSLVKGLLDYSRIGKDTDMQSIELKKMIAEIEQDLGTKINSTKTKITTKNLPSNLVVYDTELRQLFQNLITNAIKFRKEEVTPEIEISSKLVKGYHYFAVTDNGIGIAEEHQNKVFKIFKRLHNRSDYEGTGIGLAHCQKIVELHGGKIWVESELGKGSSFNFTIPKRKKVIS